MRQRIYGLIPDLASGRRVMDDLPRSRVEAAEARLEQMHPQAHLEGIEPNIPAIP